VFAVLRPGGLLVTVTKNTRRKGRLFDLAATTTRLAYVASQEGWELVRSFSDRISGATLARPALTAALLGVMVDGLGFVRVAVAGWADRATVSDAGWVSRRCGR
jgi:hypothetical protein